MMAGSKHAPTESLDEWLSSRLRDLDENRLRRQRMVTRIGPGWCERDGRRLLNFASNDYLGLCHDERVCQAFAKVSQQCSGSGASALVTGRTEWHERLETTIAQFEGTEAALVFPSGYAANVGTLSALMGADDIVFSDRLNHASLIDGCRLSGAQFRVYRHDALGKLDDRLAAWNTSLGRKFIITDGVFSMDGTVAPLRELCEIAERHNAIMIVDEAHGTGVLGPNGRGACEACNVEERVPIRIGTLSKAVGTLGGFVAGSSKLIEYLWNTARSQFFSTALPPAVCAAAVASLDVIRAEPGRRQRMSENSQAFRRFLADSGEPLSAVPIIPVIVGSESLAMRAAEQIKLDGYLVACVRPPTVPNNTSRLRVSISSAHSEDDIRRLAESVKRAVESVQGGNR